MYCSKCGAEANGKFCSSCGAPIQTKVTKLSPSRETDWSQIIEYEVLLGIPEFRDLIAKHAAQSKQPLSGEAFLNFCDKAFQPISGVSMETLVSIAQPISSKLGIKTGKTRSQVFNNPPGKILLALLCSLARRGQNLQQVKQMQDSCMLEAGIPSDLWSLEGRLVINVSREGAGTCVEAGTIITGQLYDWGKSKRCLNVLFSDLSMTPVVM